ncbi:MAG: type II toxin-antitoxin system RatA family toxin [Pseudomonadota bacterium]
MRTISRHSLVRFSSDEMFRLVDDIERYPEFLPWCSGASVHSRDDTTVEASIEMSRVGLKQSFRTRNTNVPGESIRLTLVDGPFQQLEGEWSFDTLGDAGSKVSLDLSFEFDSRITDRLLGPFFEEICNSMVNAFTKRAEQVYGR